MPLPFKVGSSGPEITSWGQWFAKKYSSYAAPVDGYYGNAEKAAVAELQRRLGIPVSGVFDQLTAERSGFVKPTTNVHRPIWLYSAPGSGADWWQGPPFEVGKWCQDVLKINHQPVGYPKGGYLGLMGGDPGLSYNDVILSEKVELARLLRACPDLDKPLWEGWFVGYSQSADGMKVAVSELFGDGGEFEHLRSRINGIIVFGDPTRRQGPTKVGNNPPGWGIARKTFPAWLEALTWDITTTGDMYACTQDTTLLPLFYEWFVKAETELPFVAYSAGIVIPALASYLGIAGMFLGPALAGMVGMSLNMMGTLISSFGGGAPPNPELVEALSAKGLLTPQGIVKVFATLAALPGIQAHGEYHLPKPEFGNRTGIQVGCDVVAGFRR